MMLQSLSRHFDVGGRFRRTLIGIDQIERFNQKLQSSI